MSEFCAILSIVSAGLSEFCAVFSTVSIGLSEFCAVFQQFQLVSVSSVQFFNSFDWC